MSGGSKRGLVAPQNTFLENLIRKLNQNESQCGFILANSQLYEWPIVYANEVFCSRMGVRRAEVINQSCTCEFIFGCQSNTEVVEKLKIELSKKEGVKIEFSLENNYGALLWFLLQVATITNEKDETIFFLLTFQDITYEKCPNQFLPKKTGVTKWEMITKNRTARSSTEQEMEVDAMDNKNTPPEICDLNTVNLPKYYHEAPRTPKFIILHYNNAKVLWDWMILIMTFYTAFIVPYNVCVREKEKHMSYAWLVSDSLVDVVFFFDIVSNFLTTIVGPGGKVISDPKIIQMNYIKSWFVVDLLSCLPYDLFNFLFSNSEGGITKEGISSLFSGLKVVRLLRLGRIARKMDHYLEYGGAMLILLVCFFCLSGHWLACGWYFLGWHERQINGKLVATNWLVILGNQKNQPYIFNGTELIGGPATVDSYIAALYFTMTSLTSVGFGNISANTVLEQEFCIVMLVFGALLYASIFGNVTTIIQQMYAETNRYHDMLNSVRDFLKLYRIPANLSDRILDYIASSWSMSKGIDTNKVLNFCPKDMKADICLHLNRKIFQLHEAFSLASQSCRRALANEFVTFHCAPGDMIYHKGENITTLNFVMTGSLEVIHDDQVIAILSKGDVFGDACWYNESEICQSSCHIKALTYCNVNSIKHEALNNVLSFYKSFSESFTKKMILTFDLRKRIYFRKISDIEHERENAEKQERDIRNNPMVRAYFQRWRKQKIAQQSSIVELEDNNSKARRLSKNLGKDFVALDSDVTASIIKDFAVQRKNIEDISNKVENIFQAIENLSKPTSSNLNNNNDNVRSRAGPSRPTTESTSRRPRTMERNQTRYSKKKKPKRTTGTNTESLTYVNECCQDLELLSISDSHSSDEEKSVGYSSRSRLK